MKETQMMPPEKTIKEVDFEYKYKLVITEFIGTAWRRETIFTIRVMSFLYSPAHKRNFKHIYRRTIINKKLF